MRLPSSFRGDAFPVIADAIFEALKTYRDGLRGLVLYIKRGQDKMRSSVASIYSDLIGSSGSSVTGVKASRSTSTVRNRRRAAATPWRIISSPPGTRAAVCPDRRRVTGLHASLRAGGGRAEVA